MGAELDKQRAYWNGEVRDFDSIYSHGKGRLGNWIDSTFRWDMYARFDYTMLHAEPVRGRTFLEVGCGTGQYALEFARRGASRVVGIDIASKMIQICQERAEAKGLGDRCEFVVSDLLAYEPANRFDVCIGIGLFDYVRDAQPVVDKMRAVVSDRAIMSLPKLWTWRAPVRKVRLAFKGCPVFFYTKEQIGSMLIRAGFRDYKMEQVGQLYCVTAFA